MKTQYPLRIDTSAALIAEFTDPGTGNVVGGYTGATTLILRAFTVVPGGSARIPLLAGTDSFVPGLGYAIPAGQWQIRAILDPAFGQARRTPPMPLAIAD